MACVRVIPGARDESGPNSDNPHVAARSITGGCCLGRRADAARGAPDALFSNLPRGSTVVVGAAGWACPGRGSGTPLIRAQPAPRVSSDSGTPPSRVQPGPAFRWEGGSLSLGRPALPPHQPGVLPPRTKRRPVRPVGPRPRRSLDGGSPLVRRVQPFTGQARPGEKGHAPRGIFSPSRTCGTLNRGLSVLITPQPREGSSVSTDTTSSRVSRAGRRGGERQPNPERLCSSGAVRSVDCWPLARNSARFPGVSPARYPVTSVDVDRVGVSSS